MHEYTSSPGSELIFFNLTGMPLVMDTAAPLRPPSGATITTSPKSLTISAKSFIPLASNPSSFEIKINGLVSDILIF